MRRWLGRCALVLCGVAQAQALDGAAVFGQHCAACHQSTGAGTPGLAPPLRGSHWDRLAQEPRYAASVVLFGLSGPIVLEGQRFVGTMPGLAATLSDLQLPAVLDHLARLQERPSAPLDPALVASVRSGGGNPAATRALRERLLR